MPTNTFDVVEWGKERAAEELAAIHCHDLPNMLMSSVAVAEALYMLGAVVVSLESEDAQDKQLQMFMDRLPEVMKDLREHHGPQKEEEE